MPYRDPVVRRQKNRDQARARRDRRRLGRTRCPLDGHPLDWGTNGFGALVSSCLACDRRRAGCCERCGRPITGRKPYKRVGPRPRLCAAHLHEARRATWKRFRDRRRRARLADGRTRAGRQAAA